MAGSDRVGYIVFLMGADLRALDPGLSLNAAQKLARQIAREGGFASGRPARRVAVLGSFSTQHLGELIRLYCLARSAIVSSLIVGCRGVVCSLFMCCFGPVCVSSLMRD